MTIRLSISFPKDLYEDLKKIAEESERSLNRQVVFMLTNMVARRKKLNVVVFSEDKEGCKYPDWEGGLITGEHTYDKDGFCSICGEVRKGE